MRRFKVNDDFWVEFKDGMYWDSAYYERSRSSKPDFRNKSLDWALSFWERLKATVVEVPALIPDLIETPTEETPTEPPSHPADHAIHLAM